MIGKDMKLACGITWKRNWLEWDLGDEKSFEKVCDVGVQVLAGLGLEQKKGERNIR